MLKKILVTTMMLLVGCSWAFSQSYRPKWAQNQSTLLSYEREREVVESKIQLKQALSQLEKRFNVSFMYKSGELDGIYVSSRSSRSNHFGRALQNLLVAADLKYFQLNDRTFVISRDDSKPFLDALAQAEYSVEGTVTDQESGETLPGVNIIVKGTTTGTSTDGAGHYKLSVPSLQDTLVYSFIGYQTQQLPINGRSKIDVVLNSKAYQGQELVVVGYGKTRKEDLTGAVSSVKGADLANIPAPRVDQVLQGRAPGVEVTQTSGAPGAASMIRIRGGNSIEGNNAPLFVVDGFIAGNDFNLNNLNTNDIESIDVLKDATAVSIYGTRGSNGVILITTKNGSGLQAGKPEVTINTYTGVQSLMNTIDLLSGPQLAQYANEDAEFRSATKPFADPGSVPDVNWIDQITRKAPIYNGDISIAGVSPDRKVNYYLSGSYFNQEGIVRSSGIQKYNFRTNLDIKLSSYVKAGVRLNVSRLLEENNKVNFALTFREGLTNRAIYDDDGNFTAINPVSGTVQRNAEADIELKTDRNYVTNVLGNAYLQIEPTQHLTIKSTFGPEINYYKLNQYDPSTLPENLIINDGGDGRVHTINYLNLLNENTVEYSSDIGTNHYIDLLGGFTWQTNQRENANAHAYGFSNDVTQYNSLGNGSDPTRNELDSDWGSYQLVSWLGRINYSFRNKYLLTLVGRVDGSSRFAESNNQYGFFPSAAVAWRLSQEPFIKQLNVFDILKVKASYGLSGSQAIDSYRTLAVLDGTTTLFDEQQQSGVRNGRPANPNLKWETTKQVDIGLEAAFFGGRLSFEANYYNKKTEDLLLNVQIPRQTGFSSKLQNLGSVRNQGLEFTLTSNNVVSKDFQWSSRFNISGNRNKVLDLGGVDYIDIASPSNQGGPGGRLIVGETVPVFVGVEYLGTWKSQDEIDASGQLGQDVGGPHFKDTDGDGQITTEDFEVLGSPQPDFYGGIGNTFSYKNVSLDFFIQGSYGGDVFNSLTQTAFFGRPESNKYAETLDRWTPENPDSDIPRAGAVASFSEIKNNSKEIEDGSYLRLKSLKLSYNLPVEKLGLRQFKTLGVYFSGSNLLLLSHFRLFDPETSRYGDSNTQVGFSQGEYPYARTLTVGIKATL